MALALGPPRGLPEGLSPELVEGAGFELIVLGAGSALPRPVTEGLRYGPAGYVLRRGPRERVTLLDCGPGSVRALGEHGIAIEQVERVMLSHEHTDHLLDLFALFFARANPNLAPLPALEVIGPRGIAQRIERAPAALGRWVEPRATTVVEFDPAEPHPGEARFERGSWTFSAHPTGHTPTAVGWRVECGGATLAYSGDTGEVPEQLELARGADLYLVECASNDADPAPHHLHPEAVIRLAAAAQPRRLLLTHFYPDVDPEGARAAIEAGTGIPTLAAHDGWSGRVEPD